jgi:hypothetical protein
MTSKSWIKNADGVVGTIVTEFVTGGMMSVVTVVAVEIAVIGVPDTIGEADNPDDVAYDE